jgi:hypothetical protein
VDRTLRRSLLSRYLLVLLDLLAQLEQTDLPDRLVLPDRLAQLALLARTGLTGLMVQTERRLGSEHQQPALVLSESQRVGLTQPKFSLSRYLKVLLDLLVRQERTGLLVRLALLVQLVRQDRMVQLDLRDLLVQLEVKAQLDLLVRQDRVVSRVA